MSRCASWATTSNLDWRDVWQQINEYERDEARLDINVRGFWTKYQMALFYVRVFDPNARRYGGKFLQQCYRTNEMEKKQKYKELFLQVENGSFTLFVFSVNGGMGKEANKCYSRIAEKLAKKWNEPYSVMMSWIWRKISFSMMKSIIMCIRGLLIKHEQEKQNVEELATCSKARCNITWLIKEKLWSILHQKHVKYNLTLRAFCLFDMKYVIFAVLFHIKKMSWIWSCP